MLPKTQINPEGGVLLSKTPSRGVPLIPKASAACTISHTSPVRVLSPSCVPSMGASTRRPNCCTSGLLPCNDFLASPMAQMYTKLQA